MMAFRHAGDLGDLVLYLPVLRALTRNDKAAVLIEAAPYTRQLLIPQNWCGIDVLLRQQPYIGDVRPYRQGEGVTYNGNDFRSRLFHALRGGHGKDKHLTYWMCDAHGVNYNCMDEPWLRVDEPIKAARVVFSRAGAGRPAHQVYHNNQFPWHYVWEKYGKEAVFIGTEAEHEVFSGTCGKVPHYKTKDLAEAARVIAGCELFVGNQSCPHAIASGMKKRIILEVWKEGPNVIDNRPGVTNGWDQYLKLPDL